MLCFRKFPVAKKFMDKRGGGSIKIFLRNFFVSQCRNVPYGNFSVLCFRKIPVAKKFMDKRGGGGRGIKISRFSFESFLSDGAENFRRRTL